MINLLNPNPRAPRDDRGAPMGKVNAWPEEPMPQRLILVRRVRVNRQGYESDGTYWGIASKPSMLLWNVHTRGGELDVYVRAVSRDAAKRFVVARCAYLIVDRYQ